MNICDCGKELPEECSGECFASFKSRLSGFIGCAFENENEFIKRFWRGLHTDELIDFYMASERCRFTVLVESGAQVTDTIKTDDYLEWCRTI